MIRRLLPVALLLALPGASAQESMEIDIEIRFAGDFRTMTWDMEVAFDGPKADEFRSNFDADEDGEVTQEEFEMIMEAAGSDIEEGFAGSFGDSGATLDGREPTDQEIDSFELGGVVGDVESGDEVTMAFAMRHVYAVGSSDSHTLVFEGTEEDAEEDAETDDEATEGEVRIVAPAGWHISSYTRMEGISLSSDKRTLTGDGATLSASDSDEDMRIVFTEGAAPSSKDSPAAGVLLAGGLLALAFVARRRDA